MKYILKYKDIKYWEKYYECEFSQVKEKIKWKEYVDENCQKLFETMYGNWKFNMNKKKAIKNEINNLQNKIEEFKLYIISLEEEIKKGN